MIRVLLVEDQTLVRQGIRSLLALDGDFEVIGEAADGEEALRVVPSLKPDVVLLDLRMPRLGGVELLRSLSARGALPPTLVLTTFDDDEALVEAMRAGAKGWLLKDVTLERLTESIRAVAAGGSDLQPVVTERVRRALASSASSFPASDVPEGITDRERDVLRLIASGFSNREIGEAFGISEGTVKNHTSSILAKLGVRDRTRAVLRAIDLGILR